ncbi:Transcriptional regulator, contains XRE-family HTH domain [Micromonospora echinospora]|uniref:Transcriptional regulator, contains XRE-family HTH domain n=1 Tax=Micromonospora echinospora TaxID=1877 RepID=A0A1C4ZHW0_MICEC|nr:helix-turn-helix domain-containing protein [Micromonospora echinospora]SCF32572.1 Transcriptional regulator, contains XRE-family HTH domain [Micromonospora echinospora]
MDRTDLLPVGRRVAYWRGRRKLSQQVLADRLGKSKSWVDKVERGVRSLDKVSTLHNIAAVLRIDTAVLLGRDAQPAGLSERVEGVERIRVALSTYEIALERPAPRRPVMPAERLTQEMAHAWTTFQHARYPQAVDLLPQLVASAQRTHAHDPGGGRVPLVETYRVTAALLVKLGAPDVAWLAVDRAMTAATGDRELVAAASVQLGQVLRESGQARVAKSVMLAAAYRIAPPVVEFGDPAELSLCGTLLVQAALAAARDGDDRTAVELIDEAAEMAAGVGDGHDHHRTGFGPTAVELARITVAAERGDAEEAVARHERVTGRDGWRWLSAEHRAAYLIDIARAYLHADDPVNAGRILLEAERIAPAEIRHRPAGRDLLAQVARDPDAPTTLTHLATTLGVG